MSREGERRLMASRFPSWVDGGAVSDLGPGHRRELGRKSGVQFGAW